MVVHTARGCLFGKLTWDLATLLVIGYVGKINCWSVKLEVGDCLA